MQPHDAPVRRRSTAALAVAVGGAVVIAGGAADASSSTTAPAQRPTIEVVASFYPLEFVVGHVGGDRVEVSNLTPAGAEPHDLELTPQDAAALHDADLVVFLSGFSPAIDDAVDGLAPDRVLDVAPVARLDLEASDDDHDDDERDDHDGEPDDHDDESDDHDDEHGHGGVDPHFWLDPTRLADVGDAVAARLADLDADGAADFADAAAALRTGLDELDGDFVAGLADCASGDIVTSHTAFAYLAQRYGLAQVGIAGLSPDEEASPAELADVTEYVREHDVTTIFYETLVDPAIAETVAAETGAATAVLDPLEGLTPDSAGVDYFSVMRANLESLRAGLRCP